MMKKTTILLSKAAFFEVLFKLPLAYFLILSFIITGCSRSDLRDSYIVTGRSCPDVGDNYIVNSKKILIDASHDGGTWWFPQSINTGFSNTNPHQGKALADYLRSKGFIVDELPGYTPITSTLLQQYDKIIRAGGYGVYTAPEFNAYENFLKGKSSLFLISEFQRSGETDLLAQRIGIDFNGTYSGLVNLYAPHNITAGAVPFYYNAGSIVTNSSTNPEIQILAWLDNNINLPVGGILKHPNSKIFFLGEINGIEKLPQPFINNITNYLFE